MLQACLQVVAGLRVTLHLELAAGGPEADPSLEMIWRSLERHGAGGILALGMLGSADAGQWNASGRQGGRGRSLQGGGGFKHSLAGPGIDRQHIGQRGAGGEVDAMAVADPLDQPWNVEEMDAFF